MTEALLAFVADFDAMLAQAVQLLSIARDSSLQRASLVAIEALSPRAADQKRRAQAAGDQDRANTLLGYQCALEWLHDELSMYLLLKQDRPEAAWDRLVGAQGAVHGAIVAHRRFESLAGEGDRLIRIEQTLFPPQLFCSTGMIVQQADCSLCGADYEACDHIAGRVYMGEFCSRRLMAFEADHIALVTRPADKRCRVTHVSDAGGMRNRMTWRLEPRAAGDAEPPEAGLRARAILGVIGVGLDSSADAGAA